MVHLTLSHSKISWSDMGRYENEAPCGKAINEYLSQFSAPQGTEGSKLISNRGDRYPQRRHLLDFEIEGFEELR